MPAGGGILVPRAVSSSFGVITSQAQLQAAVDGASGTADSPTELVIDPDGLTLTCTTVLKGKHISLTGGALRRGAGFGGLLFQLGDDANPSYQPGAKATLLLSSVTVDGGALWAGGSNTGLAAQAALIGVTDRSTLVLGPGAVLQNNDNQLPDTEGFPLLDGGGAVVYSGAVVVQGGVVRQNRSAGDGGGILFKNAAYNSFQMRLGEISANTAAGTGGGLYLRSRSLGMPAYFSGGSVTANRAGKGGGIALRSPDLFLSGSPVVRGNTAGGTPSNLALLDTAVLYLPAGGCLGSGSWLGITPPSYPGLGSIRRMEGESAPLTAASAAPFHPDDSRYVVAVAPSDPSMLWLEPAQNPPEPSPVPITVTLTPAGGAYDGTPKAVTATAVDGNGDAVPLTQQDYTLCYYRGSGVQEANRLPQPPADAGEYTAAFALTPVGQERYRLAEDPGLLLFGVEKAHQSPPQVVVRHESVAGESDGEIHGLTTQMEWKGPGSPNYRPAPSGSLGGLAPGVYQVRRREDANHLPSPPVAAEILPGPEGTLTLSLAGELSGVYGETLSPVALCIGNGGKGPLAIRSLTLAADWGTLRRGSGQVPGESVLTDWALVPNSALLPGSYTGELTLLCAGGKEARLTVTCEVARRQLTASAPVFPAGKVYDGSPLLPGVAPPALSGVVPGDRVELTVATCAFGDKAVGRGKPLTLCYGLAGEEAGRYLPPADVHATGEILPRPLAVTQVTALPREYDGTTQVLLTGGQISPLPGDAVTLVTSAADGQASQAGAGVWPVTAQGYSLAGADGGNYRCLAPQGLTVEIQPRALVPAIAGRVEKVFDGTAMGTGQLLLRPARGELPAGETPAAQGVFRFADAHGGRGKPLWVEEICLCDPWGENYRLTATTLCGQGDILPLPRAVEWQGAEGPFVYTGLDQSGRVSAAFTDLAGQRQALSVVCRQGSFLSAGGYTFLAQLPQGEGDYQLIGEQLSLKMEKAPATLQAAGAQQRWYTGEAQRPHYTFSQREGAVTVEPESRTQPGEQAFVLRCPETENYRAGEVAVTLSIAFLPEPQPGVTLSPADGENGWYRSPPVLYPPQGYAIAGEETGPFGEQYLPQLADGEAAIASYRLKNRAGALTDQLHCVVSLDTTPPAIFRLDTPPQNWVAEPVAVRLRLEEDGSGLEQLLLCQEGMDPLPLPWQGEDCTFLLEENGEYHLLARDRAGNESRLTLALHQLDQTAPLLHWDTPPQETLWQGHGELTATGTDEQSGMAAITLWEGETLLERHTGPKARFSIGGEGERHLVLQGEDRAGNRAQPLRCTLRLEPAIDQLAEQLTQAGEDTVALLAVEAWFNALPPEKAQRIRQSVQGSQALAQLEERLSRWFAEECRRFLAQLTAQEADPTLAGASRLAAAWEALPPRARELLTQGERQRVEQMAAQAAVATDFCRLTVPGPDSPAALTWWAAAYPALEGPARQMALAQVGEECQRLWEIYRARLRLEQLLDTLPHTPDRQEREALLCAWEGMAERERFLEPRRQEQGEAVLAPLRVVLALEEEIRQVTGHLPGESCPNGEELAAHLRRLEAAMLTASQLDETQSALLYAPLGEELAQGYAVTLQSQGHRWQGDAGAVYGLLGLGLPQLQVEMLRVTPPRWAAEAAAPLLPQGWAAATGWEIRLRSGGAETLPPKPLLVRLRLPDGVREGALYQMRPADQSLEPVAFTLLREEGETRLQFWWDGLGDYLFCGPVPPGTNGPGHGETEDGEAVFWQQALEEIAALSPGDTYRAERTTLTRLPLRVVRALRAGQVHLRLITAQGEWLIRWQALPAEEAGRLWWPLESLCLAGGDAPAGPAVKPNPDTGRTSCNGAVGGI